jgi:ABC-2 type transport system permease protein
MSWQRIYAVYIRYFYPIKRLDPLADMVFWPFIDILLWGLTSNWLQSGQMGGLSQVASSLLCCLLFWQIIWRTQYDISVNLLSEFWARNLSNLFSSPLKISEWICGVLLLGLTKAVFGAVFGALTVYLLYGVKFLELGLQVIPFFFLFSLSGWTLGFLAGGIIIYYGQRLQQIAWMMPWLIAPFSAIFYPVSSLPHWAQKIASFVPTTPLFETVRNLIQKKGVVWSDLTFSITLNLIYLALSIVVFIYLFNKRKRKGLMGIE